MQRWRGRGVRSVLAGVLAVSACGGGGSEGPTGGGTVASVSLNAPSLTMLQGDTATLVATAKDATGATVSAATTWASSASNVATVSASGLVSAIAPGTTTITATAGGRSATLQASVSAAPNSVRVTMPAGDIFSPFRAIIAVGGRVNWEFPARAHNVIFDRKTGAPADIPTTNSTTVSRTFPSAGVFSYACTLHLPGMIGEVEVR